MDGSYDDLNFGSYDDLNLGSYDDLKNLGWTTIQRKIFCSRILDDIQDQTPYDVHGERMI